MKLLKSTAFISLVIILVTILFFAFLPFGTASTTITWQERIMFALPTITLEILFFIKPRLTLKQFRVLLLGIGTVASLATIANWMTFIILVIFIIGLGAMSFAPGTSSPPAKKN